jgi:hypothetical protein
MLGKRLLLLAVLGAAPLAHAQLGVYADFTADRLSGQQSSPQLTAGVAYNNSVNPTGGTFGVFYDFKTFGPVRLGADARFTHITDSRSAQTNSVAAGTHIYSTLGGVRASFHTPIKLLVPYAQLSAGLGRSDFGILTQQKVNALEYHVYGGVDYNILPYLGWRVVELGYGGINPVGNGNHNYPIANISTGIVFHFGGI